MVKVSWFSKQIRSSYPHLIMYILQEKLSSHGICCILEPDNRLFPNPPIATQNICSCWLLEVINSDNEMPPILGQTTILSPKVLDFFQCKGNIGVRDEILKRISTPIYAWFAQLSTTGSTSRSVRPQLRFCTSHYQNLLLMLSPTQNHACRTPLAAELGLSKHH